MKPKLIATLVAGLFIASPIALAADGGLKWSGSASVGLRHTNEGASDPSKLNEYRDLDRGAGLTVIDVQGRGESYYLDFFGENLARDDMYLDLRGGKFGVFKYQFYNNELRHNFGSGPGARSPYSGIGGNVLTATFPNMNKGAWNTFDHRYDRRDTGGMIEISSRSPWYFRVDANEVHRKGINVFSGAQGTSPGNGFIDLPVPIDYTARNYSAEAGYSTKTGLISVNVLYSKFNNDNDLLRFQNGFFGGLDTKVLDPDNSLWKWSVNGNLRQLPWNSTLAARVTVSKLNNEVPMVANILSTGGANPATGANNATYNGEIVRKTAAFSLTSQPAKDLDTKLYWNWDRWDDRSTRMVFSPFPPIAPGNTATGSGLLGGGSSNCSGAGLPAIGLPGPIPCTPEVFDYRKANVGIEAGYRINPKHKLLAGFDWLDVERERMDFHSNIDKKLFVEWKLSALDTLTGRLKYQRLHRRSDWNVDPAIIAGNPTENYVRRFDLANANQDLIKLVLDATPRPFLDLGLEGIYKRNDYKDTPLGRTDDHRWELYASVSYGDPKQFRVMLFGDIEWLEYNSTHRVGGTTLANSAPDAAPAGGPPNTIYTWDAKNKDRSWQVGIGADWVPMERLTLKGSLIHARTNGTVDFTAKGGTVLNPPGLLPINNFDNTHRTSLNLKGIYRYSRQWEWTAGYAFERYRYNDIGFDELQYVAGSGASTSYVTGQFAFQPYTANIVYVLGTYKF